MSSKHAHKAPASPTNEHRDKRRLKLILFVAILALFVFLAYPHHTTIRKYVYKPDVEPRHDDQIPRDNGEGPWDGIDVAWLDPVEGGRDIWGEGIQVLRDEFYSPADGYKPPYTYEDYDLSPSKPVKRYDFAYDKVACWQDGGVWIKKLHPVEMQHLGINRFKESERSASQTEEDELCARLRLHGASFWTLPVKWPAFISWCSTIECVEPAKKATFEAGFPSTGGVWVINSTSTYPDDETPRFADNIGLRNALTMDERCDVIRDLGGVFCEDVNACPEMDRLLTA